MACGAWLYAGTESFSVRVGAHRAAGGLGMKAWGITDKGIVRQQNQDAYSIRLFEDGIRAVCVVCDGMGGARAGNVAQRRCCGSLPERLGCRACPGSEPRAHLRAGGFRRASCQQRGSMKGPRPPSSVRAWAPLWSRRWYPPGKRWLSTWGTAVPITLPLAAFSASQRTIP